MGNISNISVHFINFGMVNRGQLYYSQQQQEKERKGRVEEDTYYADAETSP